MNNQNMNMNNNIFQDQMFNEMNNNIMQNQIVNNMNNYIMKIK